RLTSLSSVCDVPPLLRCDFFVFLPSSRLHRLPHSLPTRRSSDLQGPAYALSAAPDPHARQPPGVDLAHRSVGHGAPVNCRRAGQDRKSTRLNSSHVEISYAVFCLKKKNTHTNAYRSSNSNHETSY